MRKKSKWLIALMALILAFSMTACGEKEEAADEPAAPSADCWADQYVALINSGEARDFADYDDMKAKLDEIREESGATYVYALSPGKDGVPSLDGDTTENGAFLITVDGSDDPDDWAEDYGWEVQFTEAWNGTPAAARSAWDNDDAGDNHDICWSAFAPVYDSEGDVICILGIDYPCADVLKDYPAWNRDADEWNGYEDEIGEEVPADVQAIKDETISLVTKYAEMLSHPQE